MRKTYLFLLLMIIILPAVGLARYVKRGEEGVNFAELCIIMYFTMHFGKFICVILDSIISVLRFCQPFFEVFCPCENS